MAMVTREIVLLGFNLSPQNQTEKSAAMERESKSESERKQCKTLTTNKKIKKEMQIREKLKILSVCQSVLVKVF